MCEGPVIGAEGPAIGMGKGAATGMCEGPATGPAAPDKLSFGIYHYFAIIEHVEIECLAQTFAASQFFPTQVHCLVPQSQAVV